MVAYAEVGVHRYSGGELSAKQDYVAMEEPLGLYLEYRQNGEWKTQAVSVTMRTPGMDTALSAGFLFTEGIIATASDIAAISEAAFGENTVLIKLAEGSAPVLHKAERNFYTTSSCGVCGKASIDAIRVVTPYPAIQDGIIIDAEVLLRLPQALRERQETFNSTGGLHASALFTAEGALISLKEDVGRHNALDKLIGEAFLENRLPLSGVLLLLSGRASFELVQKAVMAGIRVIVAIGAPSSLAVQLAEEHGVTLIGFLRAERFNVYTQSRRVRSEALEQI